MTESDFPESWRLQGSGQGVSGAGFPGGPSLACQESPSPLRPHGAFPLCAHISGVSVRLRFLLEEHQSHWIRARPNGLIFTITSEKACLQMQSQSGVLGFRASTQEFRGTRFSP